MLCLLEIVDESWQELPSSLKPDEMIEFMLTNILLKYGHPVVPEYDKYYGAAKPKVVHRTHTKPTTASVSGESTKESSFYNSSRGRSRIGYCHCKIYKLRPENKTYTTFCRHFIY